MGRRSSLSKKIKVEKVDSNDVSEEIFEVEKILDKRILAGKVKQNK